MRSAQKRVACPGRRLHRKALALLVLFGVSSCATEPVGQEPVQSSVTEALSCGGTCTGTHDCTANATRASCGLPGVRNVFDGVGLIDTGSMPVNVFPSLATWTAFNVQGLANFNKFWARNMDAGTVVAEYLHGVRCANGQPTCQEGPNLVQWRRNAYNSGIYAGVWMYFNDPGDEAVAGQVLAAFVNQLQLDVAILDDEPASSWSPQQAATFRAAFWNALDGASRGVAKAVTQEPHTFYWFDHKGYGSAGYHFLPQAYNGDMYPNDMCWTLSLNEGWSTSLQHVMLGIEYPAGTLRCSASIQNDINDLGQAYGGLTGGFSLYNINAFPASEWSGLIDWGVANGRAKSRSQVATAVTRRTYGDSMGRGQFLVPNERVTSKNGAAYFIYQGDGNLAVYDQVGALWTSGTTYGNPSRLYMQADGNLVAYDTNGVARWASGTQGNPGAFLLMQDDCNLVIYNVNGSPVWASNTRCRSAIPVGRVINIRAAANGLFVTAENSGTSPLIANRSAPGLWEQFYVQDLGGGNVALKAMVNNNWVCAEYSGTYPLIANRNAIGLWETFKWVDLGSNRFALQAAVNNKYVSAENGGASPLIASRDWVQSWETFSWTTAQ